MGNGSSTVGHESPLGEWRRITRRVKVIDSTSSECYHLCVAVLSFRGGRLPLESAFETARDAAEIAEAVYEAKGLELIGPRRRWISNAFYRRNERKTVTRFVLF